LQALHHQQELERRSYEASVREHALWEASASRETKLGESALHAVRQAIDVETRRLHELQVLRSTLQQDQQVRDATTEQTDCRLREARACLVEDVAELRRLKQDLLFQTHVEDETLRRLQRDATQAQGDWMCSSSSWIWIVYSIGLYMLQNYCFR
jgi:hypothetical protein